MTTQKGISNCKSISVSKKVHLNGCFDTGSILTKAIFAINIIIFFISSRSSVSIHIPCWSDNVRHI